MTESPGALFERLLDIMARLRGADGCPWDRQQTHSSLKRYLIEEAYEVLEAIDANDPRALREELGDLLLQVVFHAQLAHEQGDFGMAELVAALNEKMVSRHPHVFGDSRVEGPEEVLVQWEEIKRREAAQAGRRRSVVEGVPRALPALVRARRLQDKASRVQFDWPDAQAAWTKVEEELRETAEALASGDRQRTAEELGDALFSLVNVARLLDVDAEDALHATSEKFRRRFEAMEADLASRGLSVTDVSADELDRVWETAKARERAGGGEPGR
jgi:tetrapyrrole methylase family protein/MazG family protein